MKSQKRGNGPLAGREQEIDTFDIAEFLTTDGPTNRTELWDLKRAIIDGGTFGDYRGVEGPDSDRPDFFLYGPNRFLFIKKADVPKLIEAIEGLGISEEADERQFKAVQVSE